VGSARFLAHKKGLHQAGLFELISNYFI